MVAVLKEEEFEIAHVVRLSDEQLALSAQADDDLSLEVLLERYKRLVRRKACNYFLTGADREDLIQEGMVGLFKAARDYRSDAGASFHSFAELCITRQIITAIKQGTRHKQSPLNSYISICEDEGSDERMSLGDSLASGTPDPADVVVLREKLSCLAVGLAHTLSSFERVVFSEHVVGKSYLEIAQHLHREAKAIDNALQRARKKLEDYMVEKYN